MRSTIIAGNWKMNGTRDETESLVSDLLRLGSDRGDAQVVVCPPFPFLSLAANLLEHSRIAVGAQDMSAHEKGAYTGEVSAAMLLTAGCRFVILGHSERRQYHAESDELICAKARLALKAGLTPIICVGETLDQRESGKTEAVVRRQIEGVTDGFGADDLAVSVIAYEPVWAIGTGRTATPAMAQDVHGFIRSRLTERFGEAAGRVPLLYGGSVKAENAGGLLSEPDIDGALVGGASLKADEFVAIVRSVK